MKNILLLTCSLLALPILAHADNPDAIDYEQVIQETQTCLDDGARTIIEKRSCYQRCVELSDSNMMYKWCLGAGADAELKEVGRVYANAVTAIEAAIQSTEENEVLMVEYNRELLSRLQRSQTAWEAYWPTHCDFVSTEMLGGTGEGGAYASCMISVAKDRSELINSLAQPY